MKCIDCKEKKGYYYSGEDSKNLYCGTCKKDGMKDKRHCEHDRRRSHCKECGGASICEHGRRRSQCKECGGASICEHDRQRSQCKECGGASICEHDRQKSTCKECGGASICEHNRKRSQCKECGGASICEHNRLRSQCISCKPQTACQNCFYVYVGKRYRFAPYCFNCYCQLFPDVDIPRKYKIKEIHLRDELKKSLPNVKMVFDKTVAGECSSHKRPDVLLNDDAFPIIIECDENRHSGYSCENKRTMLLFGDLGSRPLRIIRFNPDSYTDEKGIKHESCFKPTTMTLSLNKKEWEHRITQLLLVIKKEMENTPVKEVEITHLFY